MYTAGLLNVTCDLRVRGSGRSDASSTLSEKLSIPGVLQTWDMRRTVTPCSISEGSTSSTTSFSSGRRKHSLTSERRVSGEDAALLVLD